MVALVFCEGIVLTYFDDAHGTSFPITSPGWSIIVVAELN